MHVSKHFGDLAKVGCNIWLSYSTQSLASISGLAQYLWLNGKLENNIIVSKVGLNAKFLFCF